MPLRTYKVVLKDEEVFVDLEPQRRRRAGNEALSAAAMPDKIAIVGGGIGGLAAALALIRRGIDVDVYEQAPELRELGAGVQISANGTRVLHALGLKQALEHVQVLPAGKAIRLWNTGQSWKLFDLGVESVERYGSPYITIHRGDLHGVIAQALLQAKPGAVHLNRKCVGLDAERPTTSNCASRRGASQSEARRSAPTACIRSCARRLFGAAEAAILRHHRLARRGADASGCRRRSLRTSAPIGSGPAATSCIIRCARVSSSTSSAWRERSDWTVEGWNMRGTTEEVLGDFRGWHADVQAIIRNIDVPYKWALALRPTMPAWSKGRCTLLGDACHPMVPLLAQGAVMALEDGFVLARCLEKYPSDHGAAFAGYEQRAASAPTRRSPARPP